MATKNDQLVQRVLIHELIVVTGIRNDSCCCRFFCCSLLSFSAFYREKSLSSIWRRQGKDSIFLCSNLWLLHEVVDAWLDWLHVVTGGCAAATDLNFSFQVLVLLVVKLNWFDCDRGGSFLEGRRQIDIFRNDSLVQQRYHTFVNVVLSYGRWVVILLNRRQFPIVGHVLCVFRTVALLDWGESTFEDTGWFVVGDVKFAWVRRLTVQLSGAEHICLFSDERFTALGSLCLD